MGKIKKEKTSELDDTKEIKDEDTYEEKLQYASAIAKPMAPKKLTKKCYKLIKKAIQHKTFVRNGLKDVQSRIRRGETGIVVFAGDVQPVDIICHLPAVCEEKGIPYAYTPSRMDLGAAMGIKRGTVTLLIREHPDYKEQYDEIRAEMELLPIPT